MRPTGRYCADPDALQALKRDGLGWGYDLECGCFEMERIARPGLLARLFGRGKAT